MSVESCANAVLSDVSFVYVNALGPHDLTVTFQFGICTHF